MPNFVLTIGHSRHNWETFGGLLSPFNAELLTDVRSNPVSGFAPWSNMKKLPDLLAELRVEYVWMGDSLGGKPKDRALYDDRGKPDYGAISATPIFQKGIDELVNIVSDRTTVLMCAEEDPANCHRRLAIGPGLVAAGIELRHIRKTGAVESELSIP